MFSNSTLLVHFDTMMCGLNKVRRLSTVNSLLKPDFILTTEWLWYWEDDFKGWNLYGSVSNSSLDFFVVVVVLNKFY